MTSSVCLLLVVVAVVSVFVVLLASGTPQTLNFGVVVLVLQMGSVTQIVVVEACLMAIPRVLDSQYRRPSKCEYRREARMSRFGRCV